MQQMLGLDTSCRLLWVMIASSHVQLNVKSPLLLLRALGVSLMSLTSSFMGDHLHLQVPGDSPSKHHESDSILGWRNAIFPANGFQYL